MRLYLLERDYCGHDECDSKLIRARTQKQARRIANVEAGDEGKIWENKERVKCIVVTNEGAVGEIIASFNAG